MRDRTYVALCFGLAALMGIIALASASPESSEPPLATVETWHTENPPELEPILGIWAHTLYERAHICVMFNGEAYEYGPPDAPLQVLEPVPPTYWRRLP
jgi:hypothetical protein